MDMRCSGWAGSVGQGRQGEAAEQRDEADEGWVKAERRMVGASRHGVAATNNQSGVVRPSQLIASVRPTEGQQGEAELLD